MHMIKMMVTVSVESLWEGECGKVMLVGHGEVSLLSL